MRISDWSSDVCSSDLFPARIRYSSMSIPYHLGCGYFGGFLPFISQYIVAKTGNPYAGLWYTWAVVALALVVTLFWLKEPRPGDFELGCGWRVRRSAARDWRLPVPFVPMRMGGAYAKL